MQGRIRAAGLAFAIALIAAAPAHAAVYTVTTTADTTPDPSGACMPMSCSLRQAIEASNLDIAADTVVVPPGTYHLSYAALSISSTRTVTITGAGAGSTVVTADHQFQMLSIAGEGDATISGITLRDGSAGDASGGVIRVGTSATLRLDHARVSGGQAVFGGGIAAVTAAELAISSSLIDGNTGESGGGIYISDGGIGTVTRIQDTTIAFNTARQGGGIDVDANTAPTELRAVTISDNQGGGVYLGASGVSIAGSILARNAPLNCGGAALPADGGTNVESGSDCGLAGHQNTDPQLATALADAGGQTPVLPIAATSPAVDIVASCLSASDQRDVARPQGAACDAGAFEVVPPQQPPPPTPTPTPTATPAPAPVPQKSVTGQVVDGHILVRTPGGKFAPLDPTKPIPVGSEVDAREGEIRITALLKKGGKPQAARFFDGIFKLTQTKTTTDLTLTQKLATCPRAGKASAAAKKKPKSRKLWGDGSGSFRTRGQYSAATVRGTEWLVQDSCAGTLTRVKRGVVSVRDNVRRKTIILRKGGHYLARPPKRR